jgi:class 3 adenylate cyclase/tetratricopeptide (TPR) repeat protein/ABC-type transport system involved in cytochrome c biogenesis ATPase subunit
MSTSSPAERVASWLKQQGLGQYAQTFIENAITLETLHSLSDSDLRELGIPLGHRTLLLRAIAEGADRRIDDCAIDDRRIDVPMGVERRQVTVMFCDLVGSTELSSKLDLEDLRDILHLYQQTCGQVIKGVEGFIARYLGDGIVAYFGYPVALEDAAESAVRAGLDILHEVAKLNTPKGTNLQVRLGIATGLAVLGDVIGQGTSEQNAIFGQVPNLAARIQSLAEPGTLVIADATKRLLGNLFEWEDLGPRQLKGIDDDVQIWRVLDARDYESRYEVMNRELTTEVLGRDRDMSLLLDRWERAVAGDGQVVFLSGEAGIGKSRMLRWLGDRLADEAMTRITLQCSIRHRDSPLHPLISHLKRSAGFKEGDAPAAKLDKIEKLISSPEPKEAIPLIAALLSVPLAERYAPLVIPAARQKALTLSLLADQITSLAKHKPVLLLLEDWHWVDPTTEELAIQIVDRLRSSKVLAIVTSRSEHRPSWTDRDHATTLVLERLEASAARQLVKRVAGAGRLSKQVLREIVAKTDGNPLFIEEFTKAVLQSRPTGAAEEGGGNAPSSSIIPSTLQDSLMARLDGLGPSKSVAQLGAVVGRTFTFEMLSKVTELTRGELSRALEQIVASALVYSRGQGAEAEFTFKHALVQEAAYESLLRTNRKTLHGRLAATIETDFPEMAQSEPEVLAHHWVRAESMTKAATYWLQAGQRAIARSANIEAIRHLSRGVEALSGVEDAAARGLLEFNLHLSLGQANYVAKGPAASETVGSYSRAQELVENISDPGQRYALLYGIFSGYHFAAKFDLAEDPARRFLRLATQDGDAGHICQAHRMLGYLSFFRGQSLDAVNHFQRLAALYEPEKHGQLASRFGADCLVAARGFHEVIDCVSGKAAAAIAMARENIAYSLRLRHPATTGWAYASAAYLYFFIKDHDSALKITTEGLHYCEGNNVGVWAIHCAVFNAWARAHISSPGESAAEIRKAITLAAAGTSLGLPLFRGVLAEVLMAAGEVEMAIAETAKGLEELNATGQFFFAPALYELGGRCLMALPQSNGAGANDAQAEAYFRKAVETAKASNLKLLELRAVTSLAKLQTRGGGSPDSWQAALRTLCDECADGHELTDLREARAMIAT